MTNLITLFDTHESEEEAVLAFYQRKITPARPVPTGLAVLCIDQSADVLAYLREVLSRAGYNVPSLYGLALGAPYLHHGQSPSLDDLFSNPQWSFHTNASNANFSVELAQSGKLADLIAFLRSIDASTPELAIPTDPASGASFDACPVTFP